jgi:hypothetical protein
MPTANGRAAYPGDGIYGHRDGYNVLYGDWSARWFGDPQQKLIWINIPNSSETLPQPGTNNLSNASFDQGFGQGIGFFNNFDQDGPVLWNQSVF